MVHVYMMCMCYKDHGQSEQASVGKQAGVSNCLAPAHAHTQQTSSMSTFGRWYRKILPTLNRGATSPCSAPKDSKARYCNTHLGTRACLQGPSRRGTRGPGTAPHQ